MLLRNVHAEPTVARIHIVLGLSDRLLADALAGASVLRRRDLRTISCDGYFYCTDRSAVQAFETVDRAASYGEVVYSRPNFNKNFPTSKAAGSLIVRLRSSMSTWQSGCPSESVIKVIDTIMLATIQNNPLIEPPRASCPGWNR